ncbi:MAG: DUF3298 domain-containing protein [Chitinophagaceae bacterium]|jgi:hypothetical protein|nr:DUF3298 domain-containing protein [Chitinophagaceae bacterium]
MRYLLLCVSIIIALGSCNNNTSFVAKTFFKNDTDTLLYTIVTMDSNFKSCHRDDPHGCSSFRITYPKFAGNTKEVDEYLNKQVMTDVLTSYGMDSTVYPSIDAMTKAFYDDYEAQLKEMPDLINPFSYEINIAVFGRWKDNISLVNNTYSYLGGAHGASSTLFANYNIATLEKLNNAKLIDVNDPILVALGEKYFKEQNKIDLQTSLKDNGFFWENEDAQHKEGEFYLNNNIGLQKDSLVWLYNSYEIAAYAAGQPSVKIPIKDVVNLMRME